MKKFISLLLTCVCSIAAVAATHTGTMTVTANGNTTVNDNATLVVNQENNGTYTVTLNGGDLSLSIAQAAGNNDFIAFNGEATLAGQTTNITFNARFAGNYVACTAVAGDKTIAFSNVGKAFQLPNADFETWTASSGEAQYWHGFKSATGNLASMASSKFASSTDVRPGTTGTMSAVVTSNKVLSFIANGTMTNGRLKAGSMTPASTDNHSEMDRSSTAKDKDDNPFYMACPARPDAVKVWIKFSQGTANKDYPYATMSVVIYDDTSGATYYQDPEDKTYNNVVARAKNTTIATGDWRELTVPFAYEAQTSNNPNADAILFTASTNATPGKGSKNDQLWLDDLELVYNYGLTGVKYNGQEVVFDGNNANMGEIAVAPLATDFEITSNGAGSLSGVVVAETETQYIVYVYSSAADLANAEVKTVTFDKPAGPTYDSLGDVMNDATENTTVNIAEAIVAANTSDLVYATDNLGNWVAMNVADADLKAAMTVNTKVQQITGVLTGVDTNPVINVESATIAQDTENANITIIDLKHHFTAAPNGLYKVAGYIDASGKLRAYSGFNGEMGQSLTIDNKYVPTATLTAGNYYSMCAVFTINEAWSANAPARVAAADDIYFDNYVIYPVSIDSTIVTGVDDINSVAVVAVRYYNLAGVAIDALQPGINIVVKTLSNGTTTVEKVIE